jgi:phosphoribosylanthranilate isomerase
MFRVKICGITNVEDAIVAVEAGADAIGLNFYEGSSRYVTPDVAGAIGPVANSRVKRIGVFVNSTKGEINRIGQFAHLDAIQLHGDEAPETVASLVTQVGRPLIGAATALLAQARDAKSVEESERIFERLTLFNSSQLVRARRFDDRGVSAIHADLDKCAKAGARPGAVLIDAATPGRYGGTGETVSWVGLADHKRWLGAVPLILAGGLTPDNVAEAIRIVRPAAVDVASGVESSPGKKDPVKVRDFVANALGAFEGLGPIDV